MIVVGLDDVVAAFKKGIEESPNADCYSNRLVTHEGLLRDLYCNVLGVVTDIFETQFGYDPLLVQMLPVEAEEEVEEVEVVPDADPEPEVELDAFGRVARTPSG